ncbi:hypothetical protein CIB48_g12104 [Xylaria polymorpha]|nr:hypothetical protein CIB48_g12104 [Xylaria polymorpha]
MTEASKPKPTDHFHHRYADKEVLRKALIEMGFKDEDIKIWATGPTGFDVQLPRQITEEEKETIYHRFFLAVYNRRAPPKDMGEDEDD